MPTWVETVSFAPWGYKICFQSDSHGIIQQIKELLPPDWPESDPSHYDRLFAIRLTGDKKQRGVWRGESSGDPELLFPETDLNSILNYLEQDIHIDFASYVPDLVVVHAGVVKWKDKVIIIPGRTHSGKSTLVYQLIQQGAIYYSDEFALIDHQGMVYPYPRYLSLRQDKGEIKKIPADKLGWSPKLGAAKVGMVVVAKYEENAVWNPSALSPGMAVLSLFDNTVSATIAPSRAMEYLPKAVAGAVLLEGKRGEAESTACLLLKELD